MASTVARAYNGGLGAMPQYGPRAKHGARGRRPLKLEAILLLVEQYCMRSGFGQLAFWSFYICHLSLLTCYVYALNANKNNWAVK